MCNVQYLQIIIVSRCLQQLLKTKLLLFTKNIVPYLLSLMLTDNGLEFVLSIFTVTMDNLNIKKYLQTYINHGIGFSYYTEFKSSF